MTFTRLAATLAVLVTVLLILPGVTGAVAYPFVDDVEGDPGAWVVDAPP